MNTYLVESYVSKLSQDNRHERAARVRLAAAEVARDGASLRFVRTLFVAEDETCFDVFEGASAKEVAEASRRAGLEHARVLAVTLDDERGDAVQEVQG